MSHRFDNFIVDTENFVLSKDGTEVKVEPLVFDLITHLLDKANTVVSKDDLLATVWQGRVVSDTTISSAIKSARKVLGDSGTQQKYIKTVHGRGFSFVIEETATDSSENDKPTSREADFVSPSLMVLVRSNSDELLAHTHSLSKELERVFSRIPLLKINSESQRIKELRDTLSPRQIYEQVGSEYILEGQLSQHSDIKFNVQLIDAKAGLLVWSHSFNYSTPVDAELTEKCLLDTVSQFEPQIQKTVYQSLKTDPGNSSAEAKYLEAAGMLALKGWHEASFLEAADLLRESIDLAPKFAHSPAFLSLLLAFGHRIGVLKDRDAAKAEAMKLVDQALDVDPYDSTILGFCGCAIADVGFTNRGLDLLNKALSINPANSQALVARGAARMMKFELEAAIKDMEDGIALSPFDNRLAVWRSILASSYLVAKDFDRAHHQAILGCRDDHRTYLPRIALAGAEFARNNESECRAALEEAKAINPTLSDLEVIGLLGKSLGGKVSRLIPNS